MSFVKIDLKINPYITVMEKYQRGKVYAIICNKTGRRYVGSTCEPTLARRLAEHVQHFKKAKKYITSFDIIKDGDYYIVLLEACPCNSRDELRMCEQKHIDLCDCVNKHKAFQSKEELAEYNKQYLKQYYEQNRNKIVDKHKQYYEQNRDKLIDKQKQYTEQNCEKVSEYQTQYREQNRDKRIEQSKQYREKNRDEINAKRRERVCCPTCQKEMSKGNIARHIATHSSS